MITKRTIFIGAGVTGLSLFCPSVAKAIEEWPEICDRLLWYGQQLDLQNLPERPRVVRVTLKEAKELRKWCKAYRVPVEGERLGMFDRFDVIVTRQFPKEYRS